MKRVAASQSLRLAQLEQQLGSRTLRTVLTPENKRLLRPERLSNLLAGTGRLTEAETAQLELVSRNSRQLQALKKRGSGKQEFRVNRALRNWVTYGKSRSGRTYAESEEEERKQMLKAIRALRFLGIDPSEGTFYVIKRKG